jgi:uncharacterized membrane protein YbhN (UPF0104 family)
MMRIPDGRFILTTVVVLALIIIFKPWVGVSQLVSASPLLIGLAVVALLFNLFMNAIVYTAQLSSIRVISYARVLETIMKSWVVESVMPGKLGSFAASWLWQKDGLTLGQGAAVVLVYRISLGLGAVLFGLAGILFIFPELGGNEFLVIVGSIFALGLLVVLLDQGKHVRKLIPVVLRDKLTGFTHTLKNTMLKPKKGLMLLLAAFLQLGVTSYFFSVMFSVIGYSPGFFTVLAATSLVQLAALIPLSINGIGIREGLMALLLQMAGVPVSITILVSGINTAVGYVLVFVFSLFWAKDLKSIRSEIKFS